MNYVLNAVFDSSWLNVNEDHRYSQLHFVRKVAALSRFPIL